MWEQADLPVLPKLKHESSAHAAKSAPGFHNPSEEIVRVGVRLQVRRKFHDASRNLSLKQKDSISYDP